MPTDINKASCQKQEKEAANSGKKIPAGYRLTPAAEGPLLTLAQRFQVKPDALVDLAVRQLLPKMDGSAAPEELDAWNM